MIMDILDKENVVIGSDLYTQIIVSVDKESNIGDTICHFFILSVFDESSVG